jgi:hypothetical protein
VSHQADASASVSSAVFFVIGSFRE